MSQFPNGSRTNPPALPLIGKSYHMPHTIKSHFPFNNLVGKSRINLLVLAIKNNYPVMLSSQMLAASHSLTHSLRTSFDLNADIFIIVRVHTLLFRFRSRSRLYSWH